MEYKRPTVKKPGYKLAPMPQYKWSKLKNYPNGSKNIFHVSRQGKIIVHLHPRQTLEQYWNIFGKFPDPVVLVPVSAPNNGANARKEKFAPIRRALNELQKPWAIEQDSLNRKLAGYIHIIVRHKDKNLFMKTMERLGRGNRPASPASPSRNNARYNLSSGLKILLRFTTAEENFKKSIKMVNRTTPVTSYKNF